MRQRSQDLPDAVVQIVQLYQQLHHQELEAVPTGLQEEGGGEQAAVQQDRAGQGRQGKANSSSKRTGSTA